MTDGSDKNASAHQAKAACPICSKPRDQQYRPFCSKRCADVDLGRWFTGSYAIPVTELDDEDGEEPDVPAREQTHSRRRDDEGM
jgi:endogenous inhibitor of DNA gyrase (YacG/DUF329 family)